MGGKPRPAVRLSRSAHSSILSVHAPLAARRITRGKSVDDPADGLDGAYAISQRFVCRLPSSERGVEAIEIPSTGSPTGVAAAALETSADEPAGREGERGRERRDSSERADADVEIRARAAGKSDQAQPPTTFPTRPTIPFCAFCILAPVFDRPCF